MQLKIIRRSVMKILMHLFLISICTLVLSACVSGYVNKHRDWISQSESKGISTIKLVVILPETEPELSGYVRTKDEAFEEGASQAANGCNGLDCLFAPLVMPISGSVNASKSTNLEEIEGYEKQVKIGFKDRDLYTSIETAIELQLQATTPYRLVSNEPADAVLSVKVLPLQLSGRGLSLQNIQPTLVFEVTFNRSANNSLLEQPQRKLYTSKYEKLPLESVFNEIENIVAWIRDGVDTIAIELAQDSYSSFDSKIRKFEIIQPASEECVFKTCSPTMVSSLQPDLTWFAIPPEFVESYGKYSILTYEIRIFQVKNYTESDIGVLTSSYHFAHRIMGGSSPVYEIVGIENSPHRVNKPLVACAMYLWQIRAVISKGQELEYTDWHDYYLKSGELSWRNHTPWFRTPCEYDNKRLLGD
ncbi:MAG: hypothetical protein ACI9N9_001973 [Enterobacterales bacterium]|jgi:hypothetical protein